jgi:hypothetical protein
MRDLVLYSRPACHLCERLMEELGPLLAGRAIVTVVDIDGDPALRERYGLRIPVLVGGGEELCGYPPDLDRVRRYLDGPRPGR